MRLYRDGVVIVDLDYLVAAHLRCREGQWILDVFLGLGTEGQTLTCVYPSLAEGERAFLAMGLRLEGDP